MAQQSVPLLQIQNILGHSSPTATQIYLHLTDKNLIESVERIQIEIPDLTRASESPILDA